MYRVAAPRGNQGQRENCERLVSYVFIRRTCCQQTTAVLAVAVYSMCVCCWHIFDLEWNGNNENIAVFANHMHTHASAGWVRAQVEAEG